MSLIMPDAFKAEFFAAQIYGFLCNSPTLAIDFENENFLKRGNEFIM
jgi:hypothetical protein